MDGPDRSDVDYWREVEAVFADALDLPAAERATFLERRCVERPDLRADVEALLASHEQAGQFITPSTRAPTLATDPDRDPLLTGLRVGAFRLLDRIGEGGMGTVYRAERVDGDFTQQVAVKLMASRLMGGDTLRRFKAERQILASLQHPHIVAMLDGGVTTDGQPYIAMELVEGVPITSYATAHATGRASSMADRIRLFQQVCSAVSFAHRHLVVHRDLKPANILVTPEGNIKVLDFGIAKLLQVDGAPMDATRSLLGPLTADYASPEQLRGAAVSTSSDVYSLGVVLFELMTGQRPYMTGGKTLDQVLATVLFDDLPRSSLPADLDAIVRKAMAKEPGRRYASVDEFDDDLQRYVDQRPVHAQADTRAYVLGKFFRRHRIAVTAAAVAVLAVVAGLGAAIWQAQVARAERDRAEAEMRTAQITTDFLGSIFDTANPLTAAGRTVTARDLLDHGSNSITKALTDQPEAQARLLMVMARAYDRLGQTPRALELSQQSLAVRERMTPASDLAIAESTHLVGRLLRRLGRPAEAIPLLERAVASYERSRGSTDVAVAQSLRDLAMSNWLLGRTEIAESLLSRALVIAERVAPESSTLGLILSNTGTLQLGRNDRERARDTFARSIAAYEASRDLESTEITIPLVNLAGLISDAGDYPGARRLLERVLAIHRNLGGEQSTGVADSLRRIGSVALSQGDLVNAHQNISAAVVIWEKTDSQNLDAIWAFSDMGRLLVAEGKPVEAVAYLRRAAERVREVYGPTHASVVAADAALAKATQLARR